MHNRKCMRLGLAGTEEILQFKSTKQDIIEAVGLKTAKLHTSM